MNKRTLNDALARQAGFDRGYAQAARNTALAAAKVARHLGVADEFVPLLYAYMDSVDLYHEVKAAQAALATGDFLREGAPITREMQLRQAYHDTRKLSDAMGITARVDA